MKTNFLPQLQMDFSGGIGEDVYSSSMNFKIFEKQLQENKTVTEESLTMMTNKTYHNGDEVKVGDKPLFGMILEIDEEENKSLTLIMLNENQIDLYETDDRHVNADTFVPIIKLK